MAYPVFKKYPPELVEQIIGDREKLLAEELSIKYNLSLNQIHYIFTRCKIKKGNRKEVHIGDKFGKLIVIDFIPRDKNYKFSKNYWVCQCQCERKKIIKVGTSQLTTGHTKSCGCGRLDAITHSYKDISGVWYGQVKKAARCRGLEFNVSMEFLQELLEKQNFKCVLSGIPIKIHPGRRTPDTTASLDRIDSNGHYTEDNVQFVHKKINRLKNNLKQNNFLSLCYIITEHQKNAHKDFEHIKTNNPW